MGSHGYAPGRRMQRTGTQQARGDDEGTEQPFKPCHLHHVRPLSSGRYVWGRMQRTPSLGSFFQRRASQTWEGLQTFSPLRAPSWRRARGWCNAARTGAAGRRPRLRLRFLRLHPLPLLKRRLTVRHGLFFSARSASAPPASPSGATACSVRPSTIGWCLATRPAGRPVCSLKHILERRTGCARRVLPWLRKTSVPTKRWRTQFQYLHSLVGGTRGELAS